MDFWYLTLYLLLQVRHVIRSLLESLKASQESSSFWIRMDFKKKLKKSQIRSMKSKIHFNILHTHFVTLYWKNLQTCKIKFPFLKKRWTQVSFIDKHACVHTRAHTLMQTTRTHLLSLNYKRTGEIRGKKNKGISAHQSPGRSLPDNKE